MLRWVCRDEVAYLDLATDRLELSPAPGRGVTTPDDVKHRALAEVLDARVKARVQAGASDMELLVNMAEQMPLLTQLPDIADSDGMSALCDEYPGLHRYAKLLERIASGIASGDIEVPG